MRRIWLDPEKLKSRGLTAQDVTAAIREQNVQVAAGQIGQPPAPSPPPRPSRSDVAITPVRAGVVDASPDEYRERGSFMIPDIKKESWAHPVIANGKLLLREQDMLYVYDISSRPDPG